MLLLRIWVMIGGEPKLSSLLWGTLISGVFMALFQASDSFAGFFAPEGSNASAFYPPAGIQLALVLWGGPLTYPLLLAAACISVFLNYTELYIAWGTAGQTLWPVIKALL